MGSVRRFLLLLCSELKSARATLPIHMIALFQPALMYLLMGLVLVTPTFTLAVVEPRSAGGEALVEAMGRVGSPLGVAYIDPVLVDEGDLAARAQLITISEQDGELTAVQQFGLIDSNLLKNYRNRLTAAAWLLWNDALGPQAVTIEEHPAMADDISYAVYFGMAMLPLTTYLAAALVGAYATAREFETDTVREYRLAPTPTALILAARMARLVLLGWASAAVLLILVGLMTGYWPGEPWALPLILLPVALIGGSVGLIAALILQSSLPSFLVALASAFLFWLLGSGFGLAAGFPGAYETVSRFIPNTYAVELLFARYYGRQVESPVISFGLLTLYSVVLLLLTAVVYQRKIVAIQE